MLGQIKRPEDELHLVDIANYLDHDHLKKLGIDYNFHLSASEKWDPAIIGDAEIWFSHHDASHYFSNVSHELRVMRERLAEHGVVILDDFTDPYSQVRAAYYHQRYREENPLELILQGWGKAVLVRTDSFAIFEEYVLEGLQRDLESYGCSTTLFRTDIAPQARAFSIALKKSPNDGDRYGLNVWGDRFYKQSSR